MHKVSVVTPAYKAEGTLARTVASVLAQTHTAWEMVIVADDGADYERCLADQGIRDPRLKFVSTGAVGTGPANARNIGIFSADGDVLAALDSDDTFDTHKLEWIAPLAVEHGLASSEILFLRDPTGEELPNHNRRYDTPLLDFESALFAHTHTYSCLVWDHKLDVRYSPEIRRMEDTVFMASCFAKVDRLFHVPVPLHHYYHREGSLCNEANAATHFIAACQLILDRIANGRLDLGNARVNYTLAAFIDRQLWLETSFETGLATGLYATYQEFLARSPEAASDLWIDFATAA